MKVAVVSDTHDNQDAAKKIVEILRNRNIHTVFHLGDIISPFTLKIFSDFRYYGVFGNNDGEKLLLKRVADEHSMRIEEQPHAIEMEGRRILLYHGSGSIEKTRKIVENLAKSGEYDAILYGHTHQIDVRKISNSLILNPGEACGYLSSKRSFAILDLETMNVEIVEF